MAHCATEPPVRRLGPSGNDPYRGAGRTVTAFALTLTLSLWLGGRKVDKSLICLRDIASMLERRSLSST